MFEVCTVDLETHAINAHWRDDGGTPYRTFSRLWRDLDAKGLRPVYVTNAGIFARDLTPLGLHVENGKSLHPLNRGSGGGNFFLKPNGVFFIDDEGRPGVLETTAFAEAYPGPHQVKTAVQSGPMLLLDGKVHHRFLPNSESRFLRNGVGVHPDGTVVLALTLIPVTFYEFALLFRDELGAQSALYLDGNGVGSMSRQKPPEFWLTELVGMIAVTSNE